MRRSNYSAILLALCSAVPLASAQNAKPSSPQATEPASADTSPKPNPDAAGKYHIGDGVTIPTVKHQVDPDIPDTARKTSLTAIALVNLVVGIDGKPSNVHIVRSVADQVDKSLVDAAHALDRSAINAAGKYRFMPARFQGKPVPVELNIEITFQIR